MMGGYGCLFHLEDCRDCAAYDGCAELVCENFVWDKELGCEWANIGFCDFPLPSPPKECPFNLCNPHNPF